MYLLLAGSVVTFSACNKTVVRENIVSAIDSGIGLTLAENRQTQMYELKAGYIRSQFYSVPTGKVVEVQDGFQNRSTAGRATQLNNAANITPEIVSGIRSNSGIQDLLLGMNVSESFAVGKDAVKSNAAVAMYIAMAKDPENAKAAAAAVTSLTYDTDPAVKCLNIWLKDKKNVKILNDWWKSHYPNGPIGVMAIKSKENKEGRDEFLEDHPESKCE